MTPLSKSTFWLRPLAVAGMATVLAFSLTACKSKTAPITNATDASGASDAADGNLAPVDNTQVLGQNEAYNPQQSSESYTQAPAPVEQDYSQSPDDTDQYNAQDVSEYATEPPPALPEYDQPPAPDPDYIWTPGYWAWGPNGYYWVPGEWCPPPYYGALWTPPYWGYYSGRWGFHPGYWGLHIGYYGGIDYGFGYIGIGYFGGYWNDNHFYYNRAVNNIGFHSNYSYDRNVVYNGHSYGRQPSDRVSYNGGRGGITTRPRPAEIAAMHEHHQGPVQAQTHTRTEAAGNRAQFYNSNHGRPAQTAMARPTGDRGGAPHIDAAPAAVRQEQQHSVEVRQHNMQMAQHPQNRPNVQEQHNTARPEQNSPGQRTEPGQHNQARPEEHNMMRPGTPMSHQAAPAARQEARPQEARPQARPQEARPQEARPQEARPEARPQPERQAAPRQEMARPAARPQEAPRPAPRAAAPRPAARPAPAEHGGGGGHDEHR
jgi:hypothetical protein